MARTRVVKHRPIGPVALVLLAVVSVQFGGALAATLIPEVGAFGSVSLRLALAAAVMWAVVRPRLRARSTGDWAAVVAFGLAIAAMNTSFYASLAHLPIGVAVTVEFTGPLLLAAALSRALRSLAAVVVAGIGVVLISQVATLDRADLDLTGLGLALLAGACWAAYILLSGRVGARFTGLDGLVIAMVVAAVVVAPVGVATAGASLLKVDVMLRGVGVAALSSVVPYSLELLALRRLDTRVFGVLLSLEPAVAAVAGLLVLGQRLTPLQLVGMACVVVASATVTAGTTASDPPDALASS